MNIVLKEPEEPGKGAKVLVSRILWAGKLFLNLVMCLLNVILIIGGMSGTATVLVAAI